MKKAALGIDIGGSTTKIVGFLSDENGAFNADAPMLEPMSVKATDPTTSFYGAFGTFTAKNGIDLSQIGRVMVTGVGSSYIKNPVYGLQCESIPEFSCIGIGGLYLSGLREAIVVSMGTGTAIVRASVDSDAVYLGGTGIGGGTLSGLAKKLLGLDNIVHVFDLASEGDLSKIDLRVGDITKKDILPGVPGAMTAANFGKISDLASRADIALGLVNMVYETVSMCAIFAARNYNLNDIILTGNLTRSPLAQPIFANLSELFHVNFVIPEHAGYSTVIGAARSVLR